MNKGTNESSPRGLHLSPLLRRVQHLVDSEPVLACLRQLAVTRGCSHYEQTFQTPRNLPQAIQSLNNEELIVGLCLAHFGCQPLDVRIAGELLASKGVSASRVALLAAQERCIAVIAHIAKAGQQVEPANPFWAELLGKLPKPKTKLSFALPHWSRFVSMTGISRNGGKHIEWLRPCASP